MNGAPPESAHPAISHCPRCGGTRLTWPGTNNFRCGECGFTLFLNTAAAVAVIMECRGNLLFGVRKLDPGRGLLDLPGGFVDPNESAEAAVRREIREELGIELPEPRYLFSFPNIYPYRDMVYRTLDLIFCVRWEEPPPIRAADDLADVLWMPRGGIDFDRIAFESIRRAVQRYLEL